MSGLRASRNERKQRYLRGLRGEKSAVSPVVATLILILIAVAAAAALYLWLVAWQGSITGGIGSPTAQYTVTIGGSTSEYPFTSTAAAQFEANNSDVVISVNAGGSGAGMLAVCAGNIEVGESSSLETPALLEANDACPTEPGITVTTVAYDAVDVIVPVANVHGLISVDYDTMTLIYDVASVANGATPTLVSTTANGAATPFTGEWGQLPAAVSGQVVEYKVSTLPAALVTYFTSGLGETCGTGAQPCLDANGTQVGGLTAGAGQPVLAGVVGQPGSGSSSNTVIGSTTAGTTTDTLTFSGDTPCGWGICAGGSGTYPATDAVVPAERSDASGTTQAFEARVLDAASSTGFETSFAGLGFSGCGGNNLLSDCGISVKNQESGNPGVIAYVAGNPDAIGYASDGLARATTSGVSCQGAGTAACGIGIEAAGVGSSVLPGLSSTGSIAGGIVNGGFGTPGLTTTLKISQSYPGCRPFEWVTLQPPTGEVLRFYQWVLSSSNNQAVAGETGEVSIYSI